MKESPQRYTEHKIEGHREFVVSTLVPDIFRKKSIAGFGGENQMYPYFNIGHRDSVNVWLKPNVIIFYDPSAEADGNE